MKNKTMSIERDPKKRKIKPVEQTCVLDFDEESSDDSDFRIEDHPEQNSDDDSLDSEGNNEKDDDSSEDDSEEETDDDELKNLNLANSNGHSIGDILNQASLHSKNFFHEKSAQVMICSGCLGDQSDGVNEIVECDSCGVTVHEACYGVSDSASLASTDSLSPTAPWFCEACRSGEMAPVCELCPNPGGIFKETDVGKWVHLVCALYVPGVAFGEVDKLTSVTLFEMQYNKWGAKTCSLCPEDRFARTGVCIGCDAGMCRTYFHVTCAQREGFLSEAHSEEVDQADPFYAHCKLHSDKTLVKRRKKNYLALQLRTHLRKLEFQKEGHMDTPEQVRIKRKLGKQKVHYLGHRSLKPAPWVPTQKMPRLITTSASACRKLMKKAELMGINTLVMEMQEQQMALVDVRKKWHIPPAFTVEFIAYYLDRNDRLKDMKTSLEELMKANKTLLDEQSTLRTKYDDVLKKSSEINNKNSEIKQVIHKYHSAILSASPTKNLPNIGDLGKPPVARAIQPPMMVPTAAALKMGVGFPLKNIPAGRTDRVLSNHAKTDPLMLNECGICRLKRDQHLLAKCDTCHLYYHLNCLNPPLTRPPKKSKLYGWQCSECDKTSDSEVEEVKAPRRSRSRYSRENHSDQEPNSPPKLKIKPVERNSITLSPTNKKERRISENKPANDQKERKVSGSTAVNTSLDTSANLDTSTVSVNNIEKNGMTVVLERNGTEHKSSKKRRREKHRSRYSPDLLGGPVKEHKRKRKKKSLDMDEEIKHPRITIKIKPIPLPAGEVASESNPQCFYVPNEANDNAPPSVVMTSPQRQKIGKVKTPKSPKSPKSPLKIMSPRAADQKIRSPRLTSPRNNSVGSVENFSSVKEQTMVLLVTNTNTCCVCETEGAVQNSIKCDECQKLYHFTCLDPPLKKTPKRRGYSWHCADCDPTSSE